MSPYFKKNVDSVDSQFTWINLCMKDYIEYKAPLIYVTFKYKSFAERLLIQFPL